MASLKIQTASGNETVELSKKSPITIGSHATNDVVIDDSGVATMHCRISWNGSAYEAVSANPQGIEVDGELVRFQALEPGMKLKVGKAVISFSDPEREEVLEQEKAARIEKDDDDFLKPLTDSEVVPTFRQKEKMERRVELKPKSAMRLEKETLLPEIEKEQQAVQSGGVDPGTLKRRAERAEKKSKREEEREAAEVESDPLDPFEKLSAKHSERSVEEPGVGRTSREGSQDRDRDRDRRSRGYRPGEEDPMRSPLVMGLGGLVVILLLVAGTYGFLIMRSIADSQLKTADTQREQGNYPQAIKLYEDFLNDYPSHRLTPQAKISLAETRIDSQIGGGANNWVDGLGQLKAFIENAASFNSDDDLTPRFEAISYKIAEGAAVDAGRTINRDLLPVSDEAVSVWQRYAPEGEERRQRLRRIEEARRQSVAAIIRQDTLVAALAALDVQIANRNTMEGFRIRRELLARYPELANQKDVGVRQAKLLEIEQTATLIDDTTISAVGYDVKVANAVVSTFLAQSRSRSDRRSTGKVVISYHKDSLLGIDALTGDPVWRRPVGVNLPFFPIPISGGRPGYLLVNTRNRDLELIEQRTGQLIWRQPLEDEIEDAPLVLEGQIYLASRSARLYQIDVETGRLLVTLQFTQKLKGPPCLMADQEHFAVAGDAEVIYILRRRPLQPVRAIYYGHDPASMAGPFVSAGGNILAFENLAGNRSRVTALDTRQPEKGLPIAGRIDLEGEMHDPALLRGNILFVPTRPEQLFAISVSDVVGQTALARLAGYQLQTGLESELFLSAGPNNRVWVSGSQLRRYQLTTDAITTDERTIPLGRTIQPIQSSSNDLYTTFLANDQNSATTSQFDRESLTSEWKLDHAGRILAWTRDPRDESGLVAVTEDGSIHRSSLDRIFGSPFQKTPAAVIKRPKGVTGAFNASELTTGELAVWTTGALPQLWIINAAGQIQKTIALPGGLEAAPVSMNGLLLLPVGGKIVVTDLTGAVKDEIVGAGGASKWHALHVIDNENLLVVDDAGRLMAYELRREPKLGFVKKSMVEMSGFLYEKYLPEKAAVAVSALDGALRIFDARNLQLIDEIRSAAGAVQSVIATNGGFLACAGEKSVEFYEFTNERPEKKWSGKVNWKSFPMACVAVNNELLCLFPQGLVTKHDRGNGQVKGTAFLAQLLEGEPLWIGSMLLVPTVDGSTCVLNLPPNSAPVSMRRQE